MLDLLQYRILRGTIQWPMPTCTYDTETDAETDTNPTRREPESMGTIRTERRI